MQAKVVQDAELDPVGWSRLQLFSQFERNDDLEISFRRGAVPAHLSFAGWQESECWIPISELEEHGSYVEFYVPPELNQQLVKTTVALRIREQHSMRAIGGETRISWPALLLAGAGDAPASTPETPRTSLGAPTFVFDSNDVGATVAAQTDAPPAAPPLSPETADPATHTDAEGLGIESVAKEANDTAPTDVEEDASPQTKRSRNALWLLAFVPAVALAVGGYLWLNKVDEIPHESDPTNEIAQDEEALESPETITDVDVQVPKPTPNPFEIDFDAEAIKSWLAETKPGAEDITRQAQRFDKNKHSDLATTLYRNAARSGSAAAAKVIAQWYDPATFTKGRVSKPNTQTAIRYYKDAAKEGDPDVLFRLGTLMLEGDSSEPDAKVKGIEHIERAADAGHLDAKKYLEAL